MTVWLIMLLSLGVVIAPSFQDDDPEPGAPPGDEGEEQSDETVDQPTVEAADQAPATNTEEPETDPAQPPATAPELESEPVFGATFAVSEDGSVTIDVGEDETRSLAVFIYEDTEVAEENPAVFVSTYEARFYLVPEGVELPDNDGVQEGYNIDNIPGASSSGAVYEIDDLETFLGLETLGVVDLGTENAGIPLSQSLRGELPPIESNNPYSVYFVQAETDRDNIEGFLGEGAFGTFNGAQYSSSYESQTGTDAVDFFDLLHDSGPGAVLDGRGGDDLLSSDASQSTLLGGDGNDILLSTFDQNTSDGGEGNDTIYVFGDDNSVRGGNGADKIISQHADVSIDAGSGDDWVGVDGSGSVYGGEGDDTISIDSTASNYNYSGHFLNVQGTSTEGQVIANGGAGNDVLSLSGDDAVADGGAGNDRFVLHGGGVATGGDGDDIFELGSTHDPSIGATEVTGGTGSDTYDLRVRNLSEDGPVKLLRITDFDPAEDVLQISGHDSWIADSVTIMEADDGSHSTVSVSFLRADSTPAGVATVELTGVTGLTEDQILLV